MGAFIIINSARRAAREHLLEELGFVEDYKVKPGRSIFTWIPFYIDCKHYLFFAKSRKINTAREQGVLEEISITHGRDFSSEEEKMKNEMKAKMYVLIDTLVLDSQVVKILKYKKTDAEFRYFNDGTQEDELRKFKKEQDKIYAEKNGQKEDN